MKGNYPIHATIEHINNMNLGQLLLKARNHRHWSVMTVEEFDQITVAIRNRLSVFGYDYLPTCCGRYGAVKHER